MNVRFARILMNQADGSPGGGSTPPPSTPQAQGAPAAPAGGGLDMEALASALVKQLAPQIAQQVNGTVFANLRKAGVLGEGDKLKAGEPANHQQPAPPPPPISPQPGVSVDDVERLVEFRAALSAAGFNAEQASLVRTLFAAEKPDTAQIQAWVDGKAKVMGVSKPTSTSTPTQPQGPPNGRPITSGGAPAAPTGPDVTDEPWRLTQEQVERRIREKGFSPAGIELREQLRHALKSRVFSFKG